MTDTKTRTGTIGSTTAGTVVPGVAMVAVTFGLARYGYGLLLPEMQSDLALSARAAGLISSGTYLSYLVANIAVVGVTTRFGPRSAIGASALLAACGMGLIALAHRPATLAAGVLVAGAASGLAFPPYAEIVATRVPAARRNLAWSAISSGTGWGVALGGPIAVAVGHQWRTAWLIFVALTLAVGAVAVTSIGPGRSRAQRPQLSWSWFLCPRSRPLLASAVLIGAGSSVWWAFSVDALRAGGLGTTPARVVYAVCGGAGVLASLSGSIFDRIGLRVGYLLSGAVLTGSLVVLAIDRTHLSAALVAAVAFGSGYNAVIAAQGIWSSRVFAGHLTAGLAAVNTALTIGTLLGPALAGAAIDAFGYLPTFVSAGVAVLAASLYCPPSRRRQEVLARHHCTATPVAERGRSSPDGR